MTDTDTSYSVAQSGRELFGRTAVGVTVGVVASLLVLTLVDALAIDVGAAGPMSPFSPVPVVLSTVVAGVGAAVAYAVLARLTARPVRNFLALAAVLFLGTLLPVFLATPSMGVTTAGQLVLVVLHATVAVPLVAFIAGTVQF